MAKLNISNIKKRQYANTPSGGVNVFDAVKQNKYQNTITMQKEFYELLFIF